MKIKICGIQDPEMALFAASRGADFIGIMRYPGSKRYISREAAIEVALAAREGDAQPIVVYVGASREVILEECEQMEVNMVQYYGGFLSLPEEYVHLFVNNTPDSFRSEDDFLLFDHEIGGTGERLCWESLKLREESLKGYRWFLAGGVNACNVKEALSLLSPYGVDISTGVEKGDKKDRKLIETFIYEVKGDV